MNIFVWIVLIFIFVFAIILLDRALTPMEGFTNLDFTREEEVIRVYQETLQRVPNAQELIDATRGLKNSTLTIQGLEQRLIDSEEYQQLIKMQSNELTPELKKMISDRAILEIVATLYKQERKKEIPEDMRLPMKDIYIHMNYNEYALRAMYRHRNFKPFEEDVQIAEELTRTTLLRIFDKYFKLDSLVAEGQNIAGKMKTPSDKNRGFGWNMTASGSSARPTVCPTTPSKVASKAREIDEKDTNIDPMLQNILKCANDVFDKDKMAKILNQESDTTKAPVKTHYGDMVLREEQAWAVATPQLPVCTSLGQKAEVQPVMMGSKELLLGTPLMDAKGTTVGSIMPKFEYKEYVEIPRKMVKDAV